jgi:hypothetical protein
MMVTMMVTMIKVVISALLACKKSRENPAKLLSPGFTISLCSLCGSLSLSLCLCDTLIPQTTLASRYGLLWSC